MVVFNTFVVSAQLDLVQHVLERADDFHVALDAQQVRLGEPPRRQLIADAAVVLVHWYRREIQIAGLTRLGRRDHQTFRHLNSSLFVARAKSLRLSRSCLSTSARARPPCYMSCSLR